MKQKTKCNLGLHDFGEWSEFVSHYGSYIVQFRKCKCCGIVRQRTLSNIIGFGAEHVNKLISDVNKKESISSTEAINEEVI